MNIYQQQQEQRTFPALHESAMPCSSSQPNLSSLSSSSSSSSSISASCADDNFFSNLGKSMDASNVRLVADIATGIVPHKSATIQKNNMVRFFEDNPHRVRSASKPCIDCTTVHADAGLQRKHKSAPALQRDECASQALPKLPRRLSASASNIEDMRNQPFAHESATTSSMRSQATGSPNFDLILDILNGNDLDRTGSKSRAGFKSSTPKSKRRSSRSIGMMHSFEALRLETDTIPEEEEEEKDEHSEDPADGDDDASISLCRWMGSSQHSTHTLPPMYPPRLEGRSDSGTNFEDDANVLGDSFGSFEISIATLDTSCASFAEAWDKPSSPEVDFDLFPLPDRVANISIVSPNAVAA